jgi:hypothetical protein
MIQNAIPERACDRCGTALQGRQRKYCSDECNRESWRARNPERIQPLDRPAKPLIPRIRELFLDGCWRTDREAAAALGVLEGSFAARRRETGWPCPCYEGIHCLTPHPMRGWKWETRRRQGSKEREHRLVDTGVSGA